MKRLIRYELSKLCFRRAVLLTILVFSMLNLSKIRNVYQSYSYLANGTGEQSWNTVYWQLYPQLSGIITGDKIERLMKRYRPLEEATADLTASTALDNPDTMTGNLYSDRNLLDKYYVRPMKYFYNYKKTAAQIAERAKSNSIQFQSIGNQFEGRKNAVIYHRFAQREIPAFGYTEMYNYLVNYDFSTVLMILLCLYAVTTVFVREKETQMNLLLLTSPGGGYMTCAAKLIAVSVFSVGIAIWFSLLDFIGFCLAFHTGEGGDLPIYAINNFANSPLNITLFQYVLLSAAVRALGMWSFCMGMLAFSMKWKTALFPFAINLSVLLALIFQGASSQFYSNIWEKIWNPYVLLVNRTLFANTEFINCLGYPVLGYQAALILSVLAGFLLGGIILRCYTRNQHHVPGGFGCEIRSL